MTKPTEAQKAEYYLISHGLYFRPEACGYTGIRDEAGLFDKSYAEDYSKNGDPVMVHKDDEKMAPEFMPAAYNDLVINHLKKQRDDALRTASAQQGVAAHNTRANLDAKKLREVEDALCDIGQIIDVVRIEWQDENSWSDWDENARKKLSKSLTILDALIKDVEEK